MKKTPILHYLRFGGFEGRDPGPSFSSARYLELNKDAGQAGINPLVHYLKYGRAKGGAASRWKRLVPLLNNAGLVGFFLRKEGLIQDGHFRAKILLERSQS